MKKSKKLKNKDAKEAGIWIKTWDEGSDSGWRKWAADRAITEDRFPAKKAPKRISREIEFPHIGNLKFCAMRGQTECTERMIPQPITKSA